jgi:hypothetical protein
MSRYMDVFIRKEVISITLLNIIWDIKFTEKHTVDEHSLLKF